jgi:hypothetical protein
MTDPFEKTAKLKSLYPDDIARIEADEQRLKDLLAKQEFAQQPVTQELLAVCRKDILAARKMLATNRMLSDEQRAEAWHIIDARLWFVKMVAKDFDGELAQLDREFESELT